mgnify:CR=1 FL=1|jgi:hypothetical protein
MFKRLVSFFKNAYENYKKNKELKKKLEEMKENDPFIYK